MIPLGVFGYATAGATEEDPLEEDLGWVRPGAPRSTRVLPKELGRFSRALPSSLSPGTRKLFSKPTFLRRASIQGYVSLSCSRNHEGKDSPTVIYQHEPERTIALKTSRKRSENGPPHIPLDLSITCGRTSLFSLSELLPATSKSTTDSERPRPRHVEILIPEWAETHYSFGKPSPIDIFQNWKPSYTAFPSPSNPDPFGQAASSGRVRGGKSASSTPPLSPKTAVQYKSTGTTMNSNVNGSSTSLHRINSHDPAAEREPASAREPTSAVSRTPGSAIPSAGPSPAIAQTAGINSGSQSTAGLSGLVCNVHRTTGREPHALVGATTTVLGDKLYVFGGRRLSRTRPQLTADLYELDLVRRHWTKLECKGSIPPPRYFHSVCALGDTKLVCYGGMSPARPSSAQGQQQPGQNAQETQPEVVVMSDIHIFDVPTREWMQIQSTDSPQGRYAHCAAILPSSAVFSSASATMSAVQHNPSSGAPNQGTIGISLDGTGGAEMVVVGGQDSANHYIEQVSVFNLRSLKWMSTHPLGRQCGAYRSVVAPLSTMNPADIGAGIKKSNESPEDENPEEIPKDGGSSMLIYSNYNFLDVKLELQVRRPDGTLVEKPMHGNYSPPGLRFPNGGVINNHFVVSGTFLTSSKQEYALWALDLKNLTWSKIDAGGSIFTQGSWNRGVLWNRRNTFVILGNRKRSLVDDYNHRRINFANICMVELEAFGLYDNPRHTTPRSQYVSVSSPLYVERLDRNAGGRQLSPAAEELGKLALSVRELADMDLLAITGERIPVNSHILARRWGPYFNQLLREGLETPEINDNATLRPSTVGSHPSRNSSVTITPSIKTAYSTTTMLTNNTNAESTTSSNATVTSLTTSSHPTLDPPDARTLSPSTRSRTLFLPHTHLTLQSLVHYLYTSSLPPPSSPLCTPQILCSLLQIARPYQIDGLLEAILERQHAILDGRNTAAIFNAAAMAAGGGSGISFFNSVSAAPSGLSAAALSAAAAAAAQTTAAAGPDQPLRIDTSVGAGRDRSDDNLSSASTSRSESDLGSAANSASGVGSEREVWDGELSAVVGLQKRGLRGLMEGRRMREMGRGRDGAAFAGVGSNGDGDGRVGLGIA